MPKNVAKNIMDLCIGDIVCFEKWPTAIDGLEISKDETKIILHFYEGNRWKLATFPVNTQIMTIQPTKDDSIRLINFMKEYKACMSSWRAGV